MKNKNLSGNLFAARPKALIPTETGVSASIAAYLDRRGIFHLRLNSGTIKTKNSFLHLCKNGTPDRLAIYRGVPLFIEVKKLGANLSEEQVKVGAEIRAAGGSVIIAFGVSDVIAALAEIDCRLAQSALPSGG